MGWCEEEEHQGRTVSGEGSRTRRGAWRALVHREEEQGGSSAPVQLQAGPGCSGH